MPISKVSRYWPGKAPEYGSKESDEVFEQKDNNVSFSGVHTDVIGKKDRNEFSQKRREIYEPEIIKGPGTVEEDVEGNKEKKEKVNSEEHRGTVQSRIRHREVIEGNVSNQTNQTDAVKHDNSHGRRIVEEPIVLSYGTESLMREEEEISTSESSSEIEEELVLLKPTFIPKERRQPIQKKEEKNEQKIEVSQNRELFEKLKDNMEKEFSTKNSINGVDNRCMLEEVDDNDDLNPEEEYENWRVRELQRLRRDYEAILNIEKEKEELERRRHMSQEEREKEDKEKKAHDEEARKNKGKMRLFQKWYHKGAFYHDADSELIERDFQQPTLEEDIDRTTLPKVLQVKDFGKRSRSKWTHLLAEDTSRKREFTNEDRFLQQQHTSRIEKKARQFDRPSKKHRINV